MLSHEDVKIPETTAFDGRWYSGNQGNVDKWAPEMRAYAAHLQNGGSEKETPFVYRYVGALVGDFHRTLLFGGIWLYPPDSSAPEGKARLLYEGKCCAFPKSDTPPVLPLTLVTVQTDYYDCSDRLPSLLTRPSSNTRPIHIPITLTAVHTSSNTRPIHAQQMD